MNLVSDCFKNDYLVFIDNVFILYEVIIIHPFIIPICL